MLRNLLYRSDKHNHLPTSYAKIHIVTKNVGVPKKLKFQTRNRCAKLTFTHKMNFYDFNHIKEQLEIIIFNKKYFPQMSEQEKLYFGDLQTAVWCVLWHRAAPIEEGRTFSPFRLIHAENDLPWICLQVVLKIFQSSSTRIDKFQSVFIRKTMLTILKGPTVDTETKSEISGNPGIVYPEWSSMLDNEQKLTVFHQCGFI